MGNCHAQEKNEWLNKECCPDWKIKSFVNDGATIFFYISLNVWNEPKYFYDVSLFLSIYLSTCLSCYLMAILIGRVFLQFQAFCSLISSRCCSLSNFFCLLRYLKFFHRRRRFCYRQNGKNIKTFITACWFDFSYVEYVCQKTKNKIST